MNAPEQPAADPPFSDYVTEFLLRPPVDAALPRDPAIRAELDRVCQHGDGIGPAWIEHEAWLRTQAAARGILPRFGPHDTMYFAEAIAHDSARKG